MKTCWHFFYETKEFRFDQPKRFKGSTAGKQPTLSTDLAPDEFMLEVKPHSENITPDADQTGDFYVTLHGNAEESRDKAHWLTFNAVEQMAFHNGQMKILGGLVTGELIPESLEEEQALGENRFFANARIVEYVEQRSFNGKSFSSLSSNSLVIKLISQFNASKGGVTDIDKFLGLYKVLEAIYCKGNNALAALRQNPELFEIFTEVSFGEKAKFKSLSLAGEFDRWLKRLMEARSHCGHLRSDKKVGLIPADPKVKELVEPLIAPLAEIVSTAIQRLRNSGKNPFSCDIADQIKS